MSEQSLLLPKTENAPAKTKDRGIIALVKSGAAAYNAKSGELVLLPAGERERRTLVSRLRSALFSRAGVQEVDCGSDAAIFSVAERYLREWGDAAASYGEERGREIYLLAWRQNEEDASAHMRAIRETMESELPAAAFRFVEEVTPSGTVSHVLLSPAEAGATGVRAGFACPACGRMFLPDTPFPHTPPQPGASEAEEPFEEIETPGANTIAELCNQLGIHIRRTIKAMLYIAYDAASVAHPVAAFVRGDYNVSMNKLARYLADRCGLSGLRTAEKAELAELVGPVAGYCGPADMPEAVTVVCDESVLNARNTVVGANRPGYHKKGCCHKRDFDAPIADIAQPAQGVPCPCGEADLESAVLRESGSLHWKRAEAPEDKVLSYRDRDGAHDYPIVCRGTFSAEQILLAIHS